MTANRIECPECETVLKPAKPIAAGKAVKCPKCGATFPAPGDAAAATAKPKAKAQAAASPAGKKPAVKKDESKPAKKPTVKAPVAKDDEDEGQTYGLVKEEGDEDEESKPKISYAANTTVKDLRGPAQAKVMRPTNFMTMFGAAGFIGWVALLIMILIPAVFPIDSDAGSKENMIEILDLGSGLGKTSSGFGMMGMAPPPSTADKAVQKEDRPVLLFFGINLALFGLYQVWMFFLIILLPIVVGMGYSALICQGAVKAQNLESRTWGIVSAILCILPVNVLGLLVVLITFGNFLLGMMLEDQAFIDYVMYGLITLCKLAGIGVGVYGLKTMLDKDVIAGFEFKAD